MVECVILIQNADFFVDAIVTDGASWNRGVWTSLGINEGNVSCKHPSDLLATDDGRRLWFVSDAPHLIKTMRNALISRNETLTPDGTIKKSHWEALVKAQEASGAILRVAYLRDEHINPKHYAKMNVPLAFELFSERTQAAMKLLRDCGDPDLHDCESTIKFTKRINDVIRTMMSRCPSTALRRDNAAMTALLDFQEYLEEWERLSNENWLPSISKETLTGFKVSLQAIVEIFYFLQKKHGFDYLMVARLNQDALERFNGMMRSACGSNDHPDATMCACAFRLLCMYSLIKPPRGTNVTGSHILQTLVGFKDTSMNDDRKKEWLDRLDKIVDNAWAIDEETDFDEFNMTSDNWSTCEDLHTYAEAYVAGYIARKMQTLLSCRECLRTLISETPQERDRMISLMSRGGLTFPSMALFQLLKLIEGTFLDVLGPELRLCSESLFDVADKLMESDKVPRLGCHEHAASVTKRVLNMCILSLGHFVGNSVNRAHSDKATRTRRLRKTAKL